MTADAIIADIDDRLTAFIEIEPSLSTRTIDPEQINIDPDATFHVALTG